MTGLGLGLERPRVMGRLVATEFLKIATGRWQLVGLGVVLLVHAFPLWLWGVPAEPLLAWNSLRSRSGLLLAYSMLFFGVVLASSDYRYRTVTLTWLITPSRVRVLAARISTVVLIGAALSTVMFTIWWLRAVVRHGTATMRSGQPAELAAAYLTVVVVVAAAGACGVALGTLTRGLGLAAGAFAVCLLVEALSDGFRFHGPATAPSGVLLWPTNEMPVSSLSAVVSWAVVLTVAATASLRRDLPS